MIVKIFCEKSKKKGNGHLFRSKRLYNYLKSKKIKSFLRINNSSKEINKNIFQTKNKFFLVLDYKNYKKINIEKNDNIIKTIVVENLKKKKFYKSFNTYPLDIQHGINSGPEFYQFPKEFYKINKKFNFEKFKKKTISILIIQGGTDANNNIKTLAKKLCKKKYNFDARFFIKTNDKNIIKSIKSFKNISVIGNVKNIITILRNIDLAISACGGLAFELGYLGIPTIHVTSEKREVIRAKLLKKKNLGEFFYPKATDKIFDEINKIYYKNSYRESLIKNRLKFFRKENKFLDFLIKNENSETWKKKN